MRVWAQVALPCVVAGWLPGVTAWGAPPKGPAAQPLVVDGDVQVSAAKLDELVGNRLLRLKSDEYAIKRKVIDDYIAGRLPKKTR